jgi:hypothetical protein
MDLFSLSFLRALLGLPFLLFLPGFTFTLALWPRTKGEVFREVVEKLEQGKTREVVLLARGEEAEGLIELLEERSFRVTLVDASPGERAGKEQGEVPPGKKVWVLMERLEEGGMQPDRFVEAEIERVIDLRDNPLQGERVEDTLDGIERGILSLGLSLAIVPLVGLALDQTPVGIRPGSVLVSLTLLILLFLGVFWYRRGRRWPSWNASR